MILKSRSLAPAPDAVVCLHGGPGSGIVGNPVLITRLLNELRSGRDIVAYDQRRVNFLAGPESRCHASFAADPATAVPATTGVGDLTEIGRKEVRARLDEIKANGADISQINSLLGALDARALNPDNWITFADLVATAIFIRQWLAANNRWAQPMAIAGNSQVGKRGVLKRILAEKLAINLNRSVLSSPGLNIGIAFESYSILCPAEALASRNG